MSEVAITARQHGKIKRALKNLNDVRAEIQAENPDYDINWYLEDSNNLNLMEGDSHEGVAAVAMYDRVIEHYILYNSGGGGW